MEERRRDYTDMAREMGKISSSVEHIAKTVDSQSQDIKGIIQTSTVNRENIKNLHTKLNDHVLEFSEYKAGILEKKRNTIKNVKWGAGYFISFIAFLITIGKYFKWWA